MWDSVTRENDVPARGWSLKTLKIHRGYVHTLFYVYRENFKQIMSRLAPDNEEEYGKKYSNPLVPGKAVKSQENQFLGAT